MKYCDFLENSQLFIPESFDECFTYEKQILWLLNEIENLHSEIATMQAEIDSLKNQ